MTRYDDISQLPPHLRQQVMEQLQVNKRTSQAKRITSAIWPTEHQEQVALIDWCNAMSVFHAELDMIYASPNGGHRYDAVGAKLRAEGTKAGIPDLFLPVARQGKHGMYIEMKRADRKNHTSDLQDGWIKRLTAQGYRCEVCYGFDEARDVLCDYLGIEVNE